MSDHEHEEHAHEPAGYGMYFLTWFSLLVLTAITVTAAGMTFGSMSVVVALLIALVKATIVLMLFMHLKYERFDFILYVLLSTFLTALVLFGLILPDGYAM